MDTDRLIRSLAADHESRTRPLAATLAPALLVALLLKGLVRQAASGEKRRRRKLALAWKAFRKTERFWRASARQP